MPSCYYVWFRKTAGDGYAAGEIAGNHFNGLMAFDAGKMKKLTGDPPTEDTDFGILEVTESDHNTMQTNVASGTYGKHVDDPTGTPSLADGDPS